jgi:hypothetical protein
MISDERKPGCDALALLVVSFALSHVGYAGAG